MAEGISGEYLVDRLAGAYGVGRGKGSLVTQTRLLLWKNLTILRRNVKLLLFQFFTPVFISLFLVYLEYLAKLSLDHSAVHPPTHSLGYIEPCTGLHCAVLGFSYTNGTRPWVDYVVAHVAKTHKLEIGTDLKVLTERNPMEFISFLEQHANQTAVGVMFCTGEFDLPRNPLLTHINCSSTNDLDAFVYSIFVNSTNVPSIFMTRIDDPMPIDHRVLETKVAIDQAIMSYKAEQMGYPDIRIEVETQDFPHTASRFLEGYDVIAIEGAFWFFIPPMVTFIIILTELVREKELKLRVGLTVMGMRGRAYWVSWWIGGVLLIFISTNVLILTGYTLSFDFFLKTPYLILLMLFGIFGFAMMMLAFLLSTVISTLKTAYTLSYAFLLVGLVLQLFMTNVYLLYLLYLDLVPGWIGWVKWILPFYPPFNFSKAFGDIARRSARQYSGRYNQWMENEGFSWYRFAHPIRGGFAGGTYRVPSTLISILTLVGDALLFSLLGWYFDHIISGNCSSGQPWYFPFNFLITRCRRRREPLIEVQGQSIELREMSDSMEVGGGAKAVKVKSISKTFSKYPFGIRSVSDVDAVKDMSLEVEQNELYTLLGHNGAGKSTLISMLVGICAPTTGSAEIAGFDIERDIDLLRRSLGYCPQHDILWDDLTAFEHLLLFSQLKGRSHAQAVLESTAKLTEVNLVQEKDAFVGTFSGGMKRRLSVAICGIGDPRVIFMDEPTTGMDPISKRQVWELIKRLKRNRSIILTTHSMEEADILSDRISIIVNGSLKCSGTSLSLKNAHGRGYKLSIIAKHTELVTKIVLETAVDAELLSESASSLIFTVPLTKREEIERLFEYFLM